jgi:methylated-DNA-protein-cysteine methyltransferase related protein
MQKHSKRAKNQKTLKTSESSVFSQVYEIVRTIPRGKVATYGQISRLMDERLSAAAVGWALRAVPASDPPIPWHRVINSRGGVSTERLLSHAPNLQRNLLEAEGVVFNAQDFIDLTIFQWRPDEPKEPV